MFINLQRWEDWEKMPLEAQDELARMEIGGGGDGYKHKGKNGRVILFYFGKLLEIVIFLI